MYIIDISSTIKKMSVNEFRYVIFENYYKEIGCCNGNSYYSIKHHKKDLQLFVTNLTEKYLLLVILKSTVNHLSERKTQNWKNN